MRVRSLSLMLGLMFVSSTAVAGQGTGTIKKFPCDPKFNESGNYIEIGVGADPTATDEIYVCFGDHQVKYTLPLTQTEVTRIERDWYDADPSTGVTDAACLKLSDLPGREKSGGVWTSWVTGHTLDTANQTYQFAMCGTATNNGVWTTTQKYLSADAWDSMRLYTKSAQAVDISKVRVVQNGVRILDDVAADEGDVDTKLDIYHNRTLDLSWRIRNTKLRRLECLNTATSGGPCDVTSIPGLDYQNGLPPVLETALLHLGRSGGLAYLQDSDDPWCSEFALAVIQDATNLSRTCSSMVPDPLVRDPSYPPPADPDYDISVNDMYDWFSDANCNRHIPYGSLKTTIQPGDYISLNGREHSALFIAWVPGTNKDEFWEISGNNICVAEMETAPPTSGPQISNRVCISRRTFSTDLQATGPNADFGGRIQN